MRGALPSRQGRRASCAWELFVIHQQGSCKFPTASYLFPYFVEQTGVFCQILLEPQDASILFCQDVLRYTSLYYLGVGLR